MDGSAILTGVLLAFNLPSNLPVWIIIIGAVVAIALGKMSFGGLGNNIFNPALVGRVFLLISFPVQMTLWPTEGLTRKFTIEEPTLGTLDRLSAEWVEMAIDEEALRGENGMLQARIMTKTQ